MTAGDYPLEASVRNHWQLVHVLAAHEFKRLDRRRFRGNGSQLTKRTHYALHAGLRPTFSIDFLYLVGRNQSCYPVILHDDVISVLVWLGYINITLG